MTTPNPDAGWRSESRNRSGPPDVATAVAAAVPTSVLPTRFGDVPLFVEAGCVPDARPIGGFADQYVVHVGPLSLYGTADVLDATLTAALDAVRDCLAAFKAASR